MKTMDIFKAVLTKKYAIEVLKVLAGDDRSFTGIREHISAEHNTQIDRVLKFLVRLALVNHVVQEVGPKEVSFYRITQRGKDILKLYRMMEKGVEDELAIATSAG
ncbi:MAG: winged helix-turn-helix transcriptional regulator [Candidatus Thorarchaeota archaeon]|nr:winged helix-turn-helix transcriptional regulator [Candidatus Thorarchaeota archaeon]